MTSASADDLSALLSSTALIIAGIFLTAIAGLVERIAVARLFDPTVYGEVALGLSLLSVGTTLSLAGFSQGVPRYISRVDDERQKRGIWLVGLVLSLGLSALISITLLANVDRLTATLFDGAVSTELVRILILTIPVNVAFTVGVATIRGLENTKYKIYVKDLLHRGLRLGLIVGLLAAGYGVVMVGYAYLAAGVVALIVAHLLSNRLLALVGPVRTNVRELVTFSAPLVVTSLLTMMLTQTDTILLGYFKSSAVVGLYNAAYPLANSLLMFVSAFGYLYLPLTSRLDSEGKREEVAGIYRITTKWGFIVTFPAFLAFVAFPGDVLGIFFGAEYVGASLALVILCLGFFTSAAAGRNRGTLTALGYTSHILLADAVTIALNLALNVVLIPPFGIAGAAAASAAAYVTRNVVMNAVLLVEFGITPFSRETVAVYLALPAVLVPASVVLSRTIDLTVVTLPVFLVLAGITGILITVAVGGVQPEDAALVEFVEDAVGVDVPVLREHIPVEKE